VHLDIEIANLTRAFEELRSDRLRQAAELIKEAPKVWFLGPASRKALLAMAAFSWRGCVTM
jgi:DNA-binding MurR/RpiR family transcriptional regulator